MILYTSYIHGTALKKGMERAETACALLEKNIYWGEPSEKDARYDRGIKGILFFVDFFF